MAAATFVSYQVFKTQGSNWPLAELGNRKPMDLLGLCQVHLKLCQILVVKNAELPSTPPLYGTYMCVCMLMFFYFLTKGEQRCCWVFLKLSGDKSYSAVPCAHKHLYLSQPPEHWVKRAIPFPLTDQCLWHTGEQWCLLLKPTVLLHFYVHQMQSKVLIANFEIMKRQGA